MTLSQKQRAFTVMVVNLILFAHARGMELVMSEVHRTAYQQAEYFRTGFSKVTHSKHQDKLAVDFVLFIDDEYQRDGEAYRELGEEWERLGGRWGGRFGVVPAEYDKKIGWDAGHFEYDAKKQRTLTGG